MIEPIILLQLLILTLDGRLHVPPTSLKIINMVLVTMTNQNSRASTLILPLTNRPDPAIQLLPAIEHVLQPQQGARVMTQRVFSPLLVPRAVVR